MKIHPLAKELFAVIGKYADGSEVLLALQLGLISGDFICLHDNVSGTFYAKGQGAKYWRTGPELAHFRVGDAIMFRNEDGRYVPSEFIHGE